MKDKTLTASEAAKYLEMSPHTLNQYRSNGKGPKCHYDEGTRRYLYLLEDLDTYLESREKSKDKKKIYSTITNILCNKFGWSINKNLLSEDMLIINRRLDDQFLSYIIVELAEKGGLDVTEKQLIHALNHHCEKNKVHPILDYIKTIKWDGQNRIDNWLSDYSSEGDSELFKEASRLILIAAIRRLKQPGCKYELLPIFEGPQGNGKSSLIQALALKSQFYGSDCPLHRSSKEVIEACSGKWIVEVSELASFNRSTCENLKSMLSKQIDEARLAYGRLTSQRPRQFVLIGTTNQTRYLLDDTGNRRFLPLKVDKTIDINEFTKIVPQLWAEAYIKEKSYGDLWLPKKLWQENNGRCNLRLKKDFWIDIISNEIEKLSRGEYITQISIAKALGIQPSNQPPYTNERIDRCMEQLGYKVMQHPLNSLTCYTHKDTMDLENEIFLNVERFN